MDTSGRAFLAYFTVRRQRRVVRFTFDLELNGLVNRMEQVMLLQVALLQVYCGTTQSPEVALDLLDSGRLCQPFGLSADSRAVCDAVRASDVCDLAWSSLKFHLPPSEGQIVPRNH